MDVWDTLTVFLELVLIVIGLIFSLKIKNKLIGAYFLFMFFAVVVATIFAYFKMNNMFAFHLETLVVLVIFNTLLYTEAKLISKRVLLYSCTAFILLEVFSLLTYNKIDAFNVINRSTSSIWFIVISIYFYYKLLISENLINFKSNPMFWYVTGLFIYFISNLLLFFTFNYVMFIDEQTSAIIWNINNISKLVFYTFLIQGMSVEEGNLVK